LRTIPVSLGDRSYEIVAGCGIISELGDAMSGLGLGSKEMIVTSSTILELYGEAVHDSLKSNGFDVSVTTVSDSEEAKSLEIYEMLLDRLLDNEFERSSGMIALGGGAVGDVTGFAAATFMRGIRFVQVPTTLLAQVDSSIGGKTGVNHPKAKNLIGAFHQPVLVWTDVSTLKTLPERELRSGLAEVVKYGVIADPELFEILTRIRSFSNISSESLLEIISRCCAIKARVIQEDEREQGLRAILNYGHTVGHALETLTDFAHYTHGEAISIGMTVAARISSAVGSTDEKTVERQESLLRAAGLPTRIDQQIDPRDIVRQLRADKKRLSGRARWVLPRKIGDVFLADHVPGDSVLRVLEDISVRREREAG